MFKEIKCEKDIKILAELAEKIWKEHYININSIDCIEYMLNKFQSEEAVSEQINKMNYEYYFVLLDDNIAGYVGIQLRKDELFLSKYYIDKQFRGKKLGRHAFEFVKEKALEKHLSRITLTVNKQNYDSIEVYKHLGFKIIDAVVTDIGNGYVMDDYIMEYRGAENYNWEQIS